MMFSLIDVVKAPMPLLLNSLRQPPGNEIALQVAGSTVENSVTLSTTVKKSLSSGESPFNKAKWELGLLTFAPAIRHPDIANHGAFDLSTAIACESW